MYTFEIKRFKGKAHVIRLWHDGWFPANPVKDVDFKKESNVRKSIIEDC